MKNPSWSHSLPVGFCLVLVAACATLKPKYANPDEYIAPMEKLSKAVDAELHDPYSTKRLADGELLAAAMSGKPELRQAFQNVKILITNREDCAIILLVSPKKKGVAWLEDATWTPQVDKLHFRSNPPSPAVFTLDFPKKTGF